MPLVTVDSRPNGEPTATTAWPIFSSSDEPIVAGVRPETPSAWMTAVSVSTSVPSTVASAVVPSLNETLSEPPSAATSTTWLLVRIWPSSVRMIPEPDPLPCAPDTLICTTDGSTLSATASTLPSVVTSEGASAVLAVLIVGRAGAGAARGLVAVQRVVRRGAAEAGATADHQGRGEDAGREPAAAGTAGRRCRGSRGRAHGRAVRLAVGVGRGRRRHGRQGLGVVHAPDAVAAGCDLPETVLGAR